MTRDSSRQDSESLPSKIQEDGSPGDMAHSLGKDEALVEGKSGNSIRPFYRSSLLLPALKLSTLSSSTSGPTVDRNPCFYAGCYRDEQPGANSWAHWPHDSRLSGI